MLRLRPGSHHLDLGSGFGLLAEKLAPFVVPGGRVLGVDLEPTLVRAARIRAAASPWKRTLRYEVGDGLETQVGSAPVSSVSCQAVLLHETDIDVWITAMVSALPSGGRVAWIEPPGVVKSAAVRAAGVIDVGGADHPEAQGTLFVTWGTVPPRRPSTIIRPPHGETDR